MSVLREGVETRQQLVPRVLARAEQVEQHVAGWSPITQESWPGPIENRSPGVSSLSVPSAIFTTAASRHDEPDVFDLAQLLARLACRRARTRPSPGS